jgi:hypothetical protein
MPASVVGPFPAPAARTSRRRFLLALGVALPAAGAFAAWLGWHVGGERSVL